MLGVIKVLLTIVEVICSGLLLVVILIQRSKNQGVGLAFGAGMGESLFGTQMGNVLSKTTVILAVIFLVNTTVLAVIGSRGRPTSVTDTIDAPVPTAPATPPPGAPPVASPETGGGAAVAPPAGQPVVVGEPGPVEVVAPPVEPMPTTPVVPDGGAAPVVPAPAPEAVPVTPSE